MEKYKSTHSVKAIEKLEEILRDNQVILEKYFHDGTTTDEGLIKLNVTCWIHPEEIEIYKKQS